MVLSGNVAREAGVLDWSLSATVSNWQPMAGVSIDTLEITLDSQGLGLDATGAVAGLAGIHLVGDYAFGSDTFELSADVPDGDTVAFGDELCGAELQRDLLGGFEIEPALRLVGLRDVE